MKTVSLQSSELIRPETINIDISLLSKEQKYAYNKFTQGLHQNVNFHTKNELVYNWFTLGLQVVYNWFTIMCVVYNWFTLGLQLVYKQCT
jgi:hypothetical protein